MKYLLIFLIAVMMVGSASGADHCVSPAGAGNKDGTDWDNAFEGLPAIGNESNLVREDTYYLADGSYGHYKFSDAADGVKLISVKKAIESDHVTDTGWSSSMGDGQAEWTAANDNGAVLEFTTNYYLFDGQVGGFDGVSTGITSWTSGHGFKITLPEAGNNRGIQIAKAEDIPDFIEIAHVEIQGGGVDVSNSGAAGIYNNLGIPLNNYGNGPQNVHIHHCYLHDFTANMVNSEEGNDWLVEYNYFTRNTSNRLDHGTSWQDFGSSDMVFRYNMFVDITGTAILDLKDNNTDLNDNWDVYGNIFWITSGDPHTRGDTGVDDELITSFADLDPGVTVTVTVTHALSAEDTITISNTTDYDGQYTIISVDGTESLVVTAAFVGAELLTGIMTPADGKVDWGGVGNGIFVHTGPLTGSFRIRDYSLFEGGEIVTINSTVLTEGIEWDAAVNNNTTATSLAAAIDAIDGMSGSSSTHTATVTPDVNGTLHTTTTDAISDEMTVSSVAGSASDMKFYNNTIVNYPGIWTATRFPANAGTANETKNNIWYFCHDWRGGRADKATMHLLNSGQDFNDYIESVLLASSPGSDDNDNVTTGSPFVNWESADFRLLSNTDPGDTLGSPYDVDMFGNTRTLWNRGALEVLGSRGGIRGRYSDGYRNLRSRYN